MVMIMIMTMMTGDNDNQEENRKRGADLTPPGLRLHSPSYLIFVTDGVCVKFFLPGVIFFQIERKQMHI